VNYTLDVWYYRADAPSDAPRTVRSESELADVLTYVLTNHQPNPPVLVARERPKVGRRGRPDHQIKIDADREGGVGSVLAMGPRDFVPELAPDFARTPPDGGVWVARSVGWVPPAGTPPLYIDKAVMTEFPWNAVLPLDLWREALHEFMRTGLRPTCVEWDVSAVY
jgi:hypothetical protein